jgi:uncharacterized protein (DUF302 family)
MRHLIIPLLALISSGVAAGNLVTPEDSPIVVYESEGTFDDIKANLEMAITGRGMVVSGTLHISEMLERTAAATGQEKKIYSIAESLEFCSALMSYKMSSAHPANLAGCPLTISVYVEADSPDTTFVTYRRPYFLGEAKAVEAELTGLLDGVVREALE